MTEAPDKSQMFGRGMKIIGKLGQDGNQAYFEWVVAKARYVDSEFSAEVAPSLVRPVTECD
jgi:hypothetical protein